MPDRDAIALPERHAEDAFGHSEQAIQRGLQGEVGFDVFLAEVEQLLPTLFRGPGHVPGLQVIETEFVAGEGAQFAQFALGDGLGFRSKVLEEANHALGRARHLVRERQLGGVCEAEQRCGLVAQRHDLVDARAIVELAGIRALIRGPRVVGAVDFGAQVAVVGIGQDRLHHRRLQAGQPAVLVRRLRRLPQHASRLFGKSRKLCFADGSRPGFGGVEHGFLETGLQFRQLGLDRLEARARLLFQRHAGQFEVTQPVLDQRALRGVQ